MRWHLPLPMDLQQVGCMALNVYETFITPRHEPGGVDVLVAELHADERVLWQYGKLPH